MSLNLLPSEAKFQAQRIRLKMMINNFLWVIGGIWILLLVGTFGTWFFLNFRLDQLNKKYQTKMSDYKSKIDEVVLTQKVKYQAKVVAKVLENRFEYGRAMTLVSSLFSEDIKIEDLQIKEDKAFELSGLAIHGTSIDEVEEKVDEINNGQIDGFTSAKIAKVDINPIKGWEFVVDLSLE
jgi:hypothetical protein